MSSIPQVTPLWLAEVRDGEVYAGRVVGWHLAVPAERLPVAAPPVDAPPVDALPGTPAATPIVAFTAPDGLLLESGAPRGVLVFLADTRDEAVAAARRVAGDPARSEPGPIDDEEDDDPDAPEPRTRVHRLRRLTVADLADEAVPDADPAARRATWTERA